MLSNYTRLSREISFRKNQLVNPQEIQFSQLDYCCLGIIVIDKLRPSFTFISKLYLDHNQLISLNGIEQFLNLQTLSFNFNYISTFQDLRKIRNKFFVQEISMVGNPIEADQRCNDAYLSTQLFKNLKSFNKIRSKNQSFSLSGSRKNRAKIKQYQNQDTYEYYSNKKLDQFMRVKTLGQGITQRYPGKCNDFSDDKITLGRTERVNKIAKYFDNQLSAQKKSFNNYSKNKEIMSTTFRYSNNQKSHLDRSNVSPQGRFGTKNQSFRNNKRLHHLSMDENVVIQPFTDQKEDQYYADEIQQIKLSDQDIEDEHQDQIFVKNFQKKSNWRIQSNELDDLSHERFHIFSENAYKSLAYQFLEQQKQQIAIAFYHRTLKEKSFNLFKFIKENTKNRSKLSDQSNKFRAFGAMKMFATIQNNLNQKYQLQNQ